LLVVAEFASNSYAEPKGAGLGIFSLVVNDPATGDEVQRIPGVLKAIASPSGDRVALLLADRSLAVYDSATWTLVIPDRVIGFAPSVLDMAWAANSDELWVMSADRVARVGVETGETLRPFDLGLASPDSVAANASYVTASPDGLLLAIGGYSPPISVIDASSGRLVAELVAANADGKVPVIYDFAVTWAGDRRLVVAQEDSTLLWDLGGSAAASSFWPTEAIVPAATSITPSGDRLLSSDDGGVQVFDQTGGERFSLPAAGEAHSPALVSGDWSTVAVPGPDGVRFVDLASGEVRAVAEEGLIRPLGLSKDGRLAILGTSLQPENGQTRVEIVDTTTGERVVSLGGGRNGMRGSFTSDGRTAVVPTFNKPVGFEPQRSTVRVIDMVTHTEVGAIGILDCVTAAEISHDDTTVALMGCSGELALLDLTTRNKGVAWIKEEAVIGQVADDTTPGVGIAFTPDDDTLMVSREDGRVEAHEADASLDQLWSFDVGEHVGVPEVHDGMVWVGAAYESGTDEISGGMVAMPLDVEALARLAREKATRELTTAECEQFLDDVAC
jgi:hypothetical protein